VNYHGCLATLGWRSTAYITAGAELPARGVALVVKDKTKHPGNMALGVFLAVIQLADHNWCFEIHHTLSVNMHIPAQSCWKCG
jgi:hypothetical protein